MINDLIAVSTSNKYDMVELKALKRHRELFVAIGVCASSNNTTLPKKILNIFLGIIICSIFILTMISSLTYLYKNIQSDFGNAMSGIYPAAAVFGLLCTMIGTFYYRQDLLDTFSNIQEIYDGSKYQEFFNFLILIKITICYLLLKQDLNFP